MNLVLPDQSFVDSILPLVVAFVKEGGYGEPEEEKIRQTISEVLENPQGVVILSEENEELTGIISGFLTPSFYSSYTTATELIWYVKPKYRNTRTSLILLNAYLYWAEEVAKADTIQVVSNQNISPERVEKLYKRKGFQAIEKVFVKDGSV